MGLIASFHQLSLHNWFIIYLVKTDSQILSSSLKVIQKVVLAYCVDRELKKGCQITVVPLKIETAVQGSDGLLVL